MVHMLRLPPDFADYESEVEAKGWFAEASLEVFGKTYRLVFYDPARLAQEIEDGLRADRFFFEANLVIISSVNRAAMQEAADKLVQSGKLSLLSTEA